MSGNLVLLYEWAKIWQLWINPLTLFQDLMHFKHGWSYCAVASLGASAKPGHCLFLIKSSIRFNSSVVFSPLCWSMQGKCDDLQTFYRQNDWLIRRMIYGLIDNDNNCQLQKQACYVLVWDLRLAEIVLMQTNTGFHEIMKRVKMPLCCLLLVRVILSYLQLLGDSPQYNTF